MMSCVSLDGTGRELRCPRSQQLVRQGIDYFRASEHAASSSPTSSPSRDFLLHRLLPWNESFSASLDWTSTVKRRQGNTSRSRVPVFVCRCRLNQPFRVDLRSTTGGFPVVAPEKSGRIGVPVVLSSAASGTWEPDGVSPGWSHHWKLDWSQSSNSPEIRLCLVRNEIRTTDDAVLRYLRGSADTIKREVQEKRSVAVQSFGHLELFSSAGVGLLAATLCGFHSVAAVDNATDMGRLFRVRRGCEDVCDG